MSSIFDFLTGNNNTSDPTANTGTADALSSYLGNIVNPDTSGQFQQAQRNASLMGLAIGLLGQGPQRAPYTFGQSLGAGLAGAQAAQNGVTDQALKAAQASNATGDTLYKKLQGYEILNKIGNQQRGIAMLNGTDQSGTGSGTAPGSNLTSGVLTGNTGSASPAVSSMTADATLPTEARAFLDTVAGPESKGAYNVRYTPQGGTTFDSYAQHPGIYEPGPQGQSSAAGRYQIVKSTFDPLAKQYGYTDFSPVTQDNAAWNLAQNTYSGKTGRDLLTDLQNGQTQAIPSALAGQWATLAKGMGAYGANLSKYANAGTGPSDTTSGLPNVPNFGGMMGGGNVGAPYTGMPSLPGQAAPVAVPQGAAPQGNAPQGQYGGLPMSPQRAQQIANFFAITGQPLPDYIKGAAGLPIDFAKTTQQKQVELNAAGPIATAQAAAKDQFAIQPNVTIKNPDGSYSEMALPHPLFRTMIGQQFGNGSSAAAPTPVAGTNFAANLPQLPGQPPIASAPVSPSGGQPSFTSPVNAPQGQPPMGAVNAFDPNVWAARNKAPIGLVNGQLLPIDGRGNAIPNAPGWGVPNAPASAPQSAPQAPQSTGTPSAAIPGPPAMSGAYGAPQGQPGQPGPQSSYQIGKPIQPPMNPVYQKGAESVIESDNARIAKTLVPAADAANDTASTASLIQDLIPQVATGYGATTIQSMARVLSQMGADPSGLQKYLTNPGSGDAVNKLFLQQSSAAVRAMGAREPGSVLQLFGRAYPSLETNPDAINLMENVFQMQSQRAQDRLAQAQAFQNQQLNNVRSGGAYVPLSNFETQFNTGTNSATNYLKAAEAMSGRNTAWKGLSPQQQTAVWSLIPAGKSVVYPDGTKGVR